MKSKVRKLEGTAKQFEIEMPKETVDKVFEQVLEDIRKTAQIPGFRSGKAPLDIIRKNYHKDAADEVKRRLVPQAYQQVLKEHGLDPVSYPEVSDVNIGPSGTLTFKAKVDVGPELKVQKYKGLKVTTRKVSVTDEEVEETLARIRNMHADFSETDRPVQKGDFCICDVETFMDGKSISAKRENMWIEADKEASMLGMGEKLCGMKKGDRKDIELTLPEKYPDKKYAGKKAVFKVEIKETKEKKLPELDDELAGKMGKNSMSEAREEIRTQLMERKEADAKITMKNQILEQLLKKYTMDLPASIVDRQFKVLMEKAENELTQKGVDKETIESHKKTLKDRLFEEAKNKVRAYFVLDAIAGLEKIDITEEETDNWLRSLADSYNQPFDDVKKYYQDHDLLGGLKEQLREEKTLDFLLSEAVIAKKE